MNIKKIQKTIIFALLFFLLYFLSNADTDCQGSVRTLARGGSLEFFDSSVSTCRILYGIEEGSRPGSCGSITFNGTDCIIDGVWNMQGQKEVYSTSVGCSDEDKVLILGPVCYGNPYTLTKAKTIICNNNNNSNPSD